MKTVQQLIRNLYEKVRQPPIELAYRSDGSTLPYGSKDADIQIRITNKRKKVRTTVLLNRLPYLESIHLCYLPDYLATQIESDLRANHIDPKSVVLPLPENLAKKYAELLPIISLPGSAFNELRINSPFSTLT